MCDRLAPSTTTTTCDQPTNMAGSNYNNDDDSTRCSTCLLNRLQPEIDVDESTSAALIINTTTSRTTSSAMKTSSIAGSKPAAISTKSLWRTTTRRFASNPSLIVVLIVVLSSCVGVVRAKPVHSNSVNSLSEEDPKSWLSKMENDKQEEKIQKIYHLTTETHRLLRGSQNAMVGQLKNYVQARQLNDPDTVWAHQMKRFEWLGRAKEFSGDHEYQYNKEILDAYQNFKMIQKGIDLIRSHNEKAMKTKTQESINDVGNRANEEITNVLEQMKEFIEAMGLVLEKHLAAPIDDSVIPEEQRDHQHDLVRIHHYVILDQFIKQLDYSRQLLDKYIKEKLEKQLSD